MGQETITSALLKAIVTWLLIDYLVRVSNTQNWMLLASFAGYLILVAILIITNKPKN